eukprot:TRINITY_DN12730_c0_g1_i1.p1 TRINITY_DN12730_c0_g1~~TRINITY_DN12730_c0_g1_i1.p1  ORF type:complete len:327 (+),score=30.74 TRINITY_DN12730_c0_g1_i1:41-982(+)
MDFFLTPGRDPMKLFSEKGVNVAAGIAVWGGATAILHPLDVWKIRSQQEAAQTNPRTSLTMLKVASREGMWRGLWQSVAHAAASRMLVPLIYEKVKIVLGPFGNKKFGLYCQGISYKDTIHHSTSLELTSSLNGFQAGCFIGAWEGILDKYLSPLLMDAQKREMYKGNIPRLPNHLHQYPLAFSMGRGAVRWGAFFTSYERLLFQLRDPHLKAPTYTDICIASVISSVVSTVLVHPIDTVQQIFQANILQTSGDCAPRGTASITSHIISRSITHAFRGIGPAVFRGAVLWGTTFPLYDMLKGKIGGQQFIEVW